MKIKLLKLYLRFIDKKIHKEMDDGYSVPIPAEFDEWHYNDIMKNINRSYIHYCAKECWLEDKSNMNWQSGQYSDSRNEIQAFKKKYERFSKKFWTPKEIMERDKRGE